MDNLPYAASAWSPVPRWTLAPELANLPLAGPVRRGRMDGSARVVLATDREQALILKLIGGGAGGWAHERAAEILGSIRRAAEIRQSHSALTNLLDVCWVPGYGYVTINEYIPGRPSAVAVTGLPLNRIAIVAIVVLDALAHIHRYDSCHGDVCGENVIITTSGDGYLLDFDLADPLPALRRTRYPRALLGTRTLAAWQAADVRAFAAILAVWLDLRRAALRRVQAARRVAHAKAGADMERELRAIRLLAGALATHANAGNGSPSELSTDLAREMRRVI
jgi:serine/threonine protein kinase